MPAGGLLATASDVARFCQMLLNGGQLAGRRYLCPSAVQQMTCTRDGDLQSNGTNQSGYGYGLQTSRKVHGAARAGSGGPFGHGGAYNTNMQIDRERSLIFVYMVQQASYGNADGIDLSDVSENRGSAVPRTLTPAVFTCRQTSSELRSPRVHASKRSVRLARMVWRSAGARPYVAHLVPSRGF